MLKAVKQSVAVVIHRGDQILAIRRPDDESELPGVWGLPAGSFDHSETLGDLIKRIGVEKLGVELSPVRKISEGVTDRPTYRLEMELWDAAMVGEPLKSDWQWAPLDLFTDGRDAGSLCCALVLKAERRENRASG